MQCCLSTTTSPLLAIKHIFNYRELYNRTISSIKFSRTARENGNQYSFCFVSPCDNKRVILKEHRILQIVDKPNTVSWLSSTEMTAGYTLLNAKFFSGVLLSFHEALKARQERRIYYKCFELPNCLFPNIPTNELKLKLSGSEIINLFYSA